MLFGPSGSMVLVASQTATAKSDASSRLRRSFGLSPFQPGCVNLIVEIGHFPSWPLIEMRRP